VPDVAIGQRIDVSNIAALDDEIFVVFCRHSDKIFVYSTAEMMSELKRADAFRRLKPNTVPPTDQLPRRNMVIKRTIQTTSPPNADLSTLEVVFFSCAT
jgi:hypothetical protein